MSKPKIKITLVDRIGKCGCHRGHKIGDTFDYETDVASYVQWQCMLPFLTSIFSATAAHRPLPATERSASAARMGM